MLFYTVYQIIIGTDLTYYCQYVLNDVNLVMPLSAAEKIATIVGIAMLPSILPRYGKRNLICMGCLVGIAGQLLFLLKITSVPLGIVSCIMRGIGIAPFYGVQYSLPSDAIEYGQWKTGIRVEGLMFSSMSMGQKAGSGFTSAIMGAILSWAAFDGLKATAAEQTVEAIQVIKVFYLYVPIAIWMVMFLIAACYKLDKRYDKMIAELIAREECTENSIAIPESRSSNQINIAIGRLYGASGKRIADKLAQKLDCRLYDSEIIQILVDKFGMETPNIVSFQKYLDSYSGSSQVTFEPYSFSAAGVAGDLTDVQMFEEQSKIILELAKKAPGVFLGRCANIILRNQPHTYSFFMCADDDYRAKEGEEFLGNLKLEELKQRDELRNKYCQRFTGVRRDDPRNYDLVINVSKTGVDGAVQMILDYVAQMESISSSSL